MSGWVVSFFSLLWLDIIIELECLCTLTGHWELLPSWTSESGKIGPWWGQQIQGSQWACPTPTPCNQEKWNSESTKLGRYPQPVENLWRSSLSVEGNPACQWSGIEMSFEAEQRDKLAKLAPPPQAHTARHWALSNPEESPPQRRQKVRVVGYQLAAPVVQWTKGPISLQQDLNIRGGTSMTWGNEKKGKKADKHIRVLKECIACCILCISTGDLALEVPQSRIPPPSLWAPPKAGGAKPYLPSTLLTVFCVCSQVQLSKQAPRGETTNQLQFHLLEYKK